jgi:hypothetical protein
LLVVHELKIRSPTYSKIKLVFARLNHQEDLLTAKSTSVKIYNLTVRLIGVLIISLNEFDASLIARGAATDLTWMFFAIGIIVVDVEFVAATRTTVV